MKSKTKFILFALITISWTCVIFSMSIQPAQESNELSGGLVDWLVNHVLTPVLGQIENLHHIVRKIAHFAEYATLGMFAAITLYQTGFIKKSLWAFIYCVAVASVDETIQSFNPGRSGQISDVILDSVGGLFGILIVILVLHLLRRRKHEDG